jgi:hypothetical protein
MKPILVAAIVSLGLVTGAFARTPNAMSIATPRAPPIPIITPDLHPSPCNLGPRVALVSYDAVRLADYKCAGTVRPRAPSSGK